MANNDGTPRSLARAAWIRTLQTNVNDISQPHHLLALNVDDTMEVCLKVLSSHDFLSVPVLDRGNFKGFVDVLDIAGFTLEIFKKHSQSLDLAGDSFKDFFQSTVQNVINFSLWDEPVIVLENATLHEVVEAFHASQRHFSPHRIAVLNHSNQLINLITQWDILKFVLQHMGIVPDELRKRTVAELNFASGGTPIVARLDAPFVDSLNLLYEHRVSGIGIVDESNRLVGNLSASDLRGIFGAESFQFFLGSTLQFLAKGTSRPQAGPPLSCEGDTLIWNVVRMMVSEKVHRVYVIDESGQPIGIVTATDILRLLR